MRAGIHRSLLAAIAAATLAGGLPLVRGQSVAEIEQQVKAGYLYNFAKFVEWPGETEARNGAPIIFGVVGKGPFASLLEKTVDGKTINGRPLVVRRLAENQPLNSCHILFVSSTVKKRPEAILQTLEGTSVLTVGEAEGFAHRGGMVNFTMEQNRVHFEVNLAAVQRAGLKLSSRLLTLATLVGNGPEGNRR